MRRFQGKSVLVLVTAVLLLGDMFWVRNGIPQLDSNPPAATSAAPAKVQLFVLSPAEATPSMPTRRARTISPFWAPAAAVASSSKPVTVSVLPPEAPVPGDREPMVALARESVPVSAAQSISAPLYGLRSPVVRLAGAPPDGGQPPTVRLDATLPPRRWSPPVDVAYIRWWTA